MSEQEAVFAYERIFCDIKSRITSGELPAGIKLPPDSEQAKILGVNRLTVRKAMERLRKSGLVLRQKGRGTFVNQQPQVRPIRNILYVGCLEGHFYRDLYLAVQRAGQHVGVCVSGFDVDADDDAGRLPDFIAGADVVIALADTCRQKPAMEMVGRARRLVLVGDEDRIESGADFCINFSRAAAAERAAQHLVEKGHRRIALVTHGIPEHWGQTYDGADPVWHAVSRRFKSVMSDNAEHPEWSVIGTDVSQPEQSFRHLLQRLDMPDRPTAIICDSDFRAQWVYAAAGRLGLALPDDLSVVGICDTPWAKQLLPALTSVNLGEVAAAEILARFFSGQWPSTPVSCCMTPVLVERESVSRVE